MNLKNDTLNLLNELVKDTKTNSDCIIHVALLDYKNKREYTKIILDKELEVKK